MSYDEGEAGANRLLREQSPYLRLHAHNPVDWFPWGAEAFEKARRENKPIFLSIGYFTCHWCHVMERESFADAHIAEILNRDFVSVKVDREERPDVDRVYMTFVQATSGTGGWPLSAFLTPDLQPFFGGTYFPPGPRQGQPGFASLLRTIAQTWREQRNRVHESAAAFGAALREQLTAPPPAGSADILGDESRVNLWNRLHQQLSGAFDAAAGGFGGAPKFPRPAAIEFLFRFATLPGQNPEAADSALVMAFDTLRAMARGGICDQLGGGFHRYATDAGWRVPHFEKMLYDQAQLLTVYAAAWQLGGEELFARAARDIADYVLREMTAPEGAFFSAQDADSEIPPGRLQPEPEGGAPRQGEGAFYVWSEAEFEAALADDLILQLDAPTTVEAPFAALVRRHFGIEPGGNVAAGLDPHHEFSGLNILYLAAEPAELAAAAGWPLEALNEQLGRARAQLLAYRQHRPRPATDDKVIAAWNGLMISGLARAGAALGEPRYLGAAHAAAVWIERHLYDAATHTLYRRYRGTDRAIAGFADDYAYLIQALLDLFETDSDPHWLTWARDLQRRQDALFQAEAGGYYGASATPELWLRLREDYDGAEPSPNSIAASNLIRLGLWFDDAELRRQAGRTIAAFAGRLHSLPEAMPLLVAAMEAVAHPLGLIAITGPEGFATANPLLPPDPERRRARELLAVVRGAYHPRHALVVLDGSARSVALAQISSRVAELGSASAGAPAAVVCEDFVCLPAITEPAELNRKLRHPRPPAK